MLGEVFAEKARHQAMQESALHFVETAFAVVLAGEGTVDVAISKMHADLEAFIAAGEHRVPDPGKPPLTDQEADLMAASLREAAEMGAKRTQDAFAYMRRVVVADKAQRAV
jgi:hypothetical protein